MKKGKRLYVSLTNDCTTNCAFCSMNSAKGKETYLTFERFRTIVDTCETEFELQLEGGEPLVHPHLWLFLEYALATGRCAKIILVTNGALLEAKLPKLAFIHEEHPTIPVEIKISLNYWLLKEQEDHVGLIQRVIFATRHIPLWDVTVNVRERNKDDYRPLLEEAGLLPYANIYKLQAYGKLMDTVVYEKPVIVQNIENWELYGSDGTPFGQDLIARSEAEKLLP